MPIEVAMVKSWLAAVAMGRGEVLVGGFFLYDMQVLDEDIDRAVRCIVAVEDARDSIFEHPRTAGRVRLRRAQKPRVRPKP